LDKFGYRSGTRAPKRVTPMARVDVLVLLAGTHNTVFGRTCERRLGRWQGKLGCAPREVVAWKGKYILLEWVCGFGMYPLDEHWEFGFLQEVEI